MKKLRTLSTLKHTLEVQLTLSELVSGISADYTEFLFALAQDAKELAKGGDEYLHQIVIILEKCAKDVKKLEDLSNNQRIGIATITEDVF